MSWEVGAESSPNITGFFKRGVSYEVERRVKTVQGELLFLIRKKFVHSGSGIDQQFLICSGTDVTEERLAQERLTELANTDSLTGLANRNAIEDKIRTSITTLAAGESVGILFLDLDNFKKVNDCYDHGFGDRLIKDVSAIISTCLD